MTTTYKLNKELNGIEITFSECPPVKVRNLLKENGFRWHKQKKLWYAKETPERKEIAENITLLVDIHEYGEKILEEEKPTPAYGKTPRNKWGVKVGDIFKASWGYEQTNVDFFQVVALAGKSSVRVRAVNPPMIDEKAISGMSADRTYKITNEILPAIDSIFIKDKEKGDLKRLKDYNDTIPYFTVGASKELAKLCTGDTLTTYESWYY